MMLWQEMVMRRPGCEGAGYGHREKLFELLSAFRLILEEECSCLYLRTVLKLAIG